MGSTRALRPIGIVLFSSWLTLAMPYAARAAPPLTYGRCSDSDRAWIERFDVHDATQSKRYGLQAHARQCHDEGQYDKAVNDWLKVFTIAPASDPESFDVHIWLGIDEQCLGNDKAALREWNLGLRGWRALTPDTPNTAAPDHLFVSGRYHEAFASYALTEVFSGYNPWVFRNVNAAVDWYNDAVREAEAGDYDRALSDVRRVLHATQDAYPAYLLYGDLLLIKGSRQAAIIQWEETLHTFSADPPGPPESRWYPSHWVALAMLRHYVGGGD